MTGIINYNELWKAMRSGYYRRSENPGSRWDERARKFNESAMRNKERTEKQLANLELKPDYTVLDVGCGTGRLAIPIAKQVASVTAVDQSEGMLGIPSKLEGKWGYYIQINNLLLQIYANGVLNHVIDVNLNLKSIRKCY